MNLRNSRWSVGAMMLVLVVCVWYGINIDTWGRNRVIHNDVITYYAYLPAAFIFKDMSFAYAADLPADFDGTIWLESAPSGKPILRMTMGLSMVWTPFFLAGHALAHATGASTYGYSWPYSLSIFVAAIFYMMAGLFFLRKILRRYFSDIVTAFTLLLVVLATNFMYYVTSEPGMSHAYNFGLIAAFLYCSLKWTEKPGMAYTLALGFLAGLIVLIRPINAIVLLFPALVGVSSWNDFKNRVVNNIRWILLGGVAAFLVLLPQLLFWKAQTGHFFFNSYMDAGKFYFLDPQLLHGLFSYRKGWLLYTPVMIFALVGMLWLRKTAAPLQLPVILFVVVNIYVVYSWWCWWYGGSFGSRPMIDMYGIMSLPLAAFIDKAWKQRAWIRGVATGILVLLLLFNQFQTKQYRSSLLHWDSMTKEAYWGIFGKIRWPEGYATMVKEPDYDKALRGEKEYPYTE